MGEGRHGSERIKKMSVKLLDLIPYGRNNSISTNTLAEAEQTDARNIRNSISRLRRKGVIICSNIDASIGATGYFRPETKEELETFVRIETARIKTHREAIEPARRALRKMERSERTGR